MVLDTKLHIEHPARDVQIGQLSGYGAQGSLSIITKLTSGVEVAVEVERVQRPVVDEVANSKGEGREFQGCQRTSSLR